MKPWSFEFLRSQVVGIDSSFETPFGRRMLVYCDYTASGRCLAFIERYVQCLQRNYANTHTEDDLTGRSMSQLLHAAEAMIKRSVNAGPNGRIIAGPMGAEEGILYAECNLELGIQMKLRHDFAGHYNRPDIFHLHVNRAAPTLYRVHGEPEALPGLREGEALAPPSPRLAPPIQETD